MDGPYSFFRDHMAYCTTSPLWGKTSPCPRQNLFPYFTDTNIGNHFVANDEDGPTNDECQDWIREFQLEYLKRGIKDRKAQECYLLKLAEQYDDKFNSSGDWKDALKVNILVPHILIQCVDNVLTMLDIWYLYVNWLLNKIENQNNNLSIMFVKNYTCFWGLV